MLATLLYNDKNTDIDINGVGFHKLVLTQIPYFNCVNKYQDSLELKISTETAKIFKKWLYEQQIDKDELNLDIGIEIRDFSQYIDIKFYTDIKNKLFVYVLESKNSDIQFRYFVNFNYYNKRFNFKSYQVQTLDKESFHYAVCLENGIGCEKDEKEAFKLYKLGWEENGDSDSLFCYAQCLEEGTGCEKDEKEANRLYKLNWEENKDSDSLYKYIGREKDEKEAFRLYKLNWEENKDSDSLFMYARHLQEGIGCKKDEKEAFRLFKLGWEDNKDSDSLFMYARCLLFGIGCEKNEIEGFRLHKLNWEEYEDKDSLKCYIHCLQYGVGCEQDNLLAQTLRNSL